MSYLHALLGVVLFSATTFGAVAISKRICRTIEPFADGPRPATPPIKFMYLTACIVGCTLGLHLIEPVTLCMTALCNGCLIGAWYCDTRCGIIPDWFTIPPTIALLVFGICAHAFLSIGIATLLLVIFAFQAWRSKGLGMGWGDAKLVTFGGILLGPNALFMTMLSCVALIVVARLTNRMREPVALAPYLVFAYESGLALFHGFH